MSSSSDLNQRLTAFQAALSQQEQNLAQLRTQFAELQALVAADNAQSTSVEDVPPAPVPPAPEEPLSFAPVEEPAPIEAAPAASADSDAMQALIATSNGLADMLEQKRIGVDPADVGFLRMAEPVLGQATPDVLPTRVGEFLGFIDKLSALYLGKCYAPLQAELIRLRQAIAALPGTALQLIQTNGLSTEADQLALPISQPIITGTGWQGDTPKKAKAFGVRAAANEFEAAQWLLIEDLYAVLLKKFSAALKKDIMHIVGSAIKGQLAHDALTVRNVLNSHTKWTTDTSGKAAQAAIKVLRDAGLAAFQLHPGERYNPATHPAKKYEHIDVAGDGASGTVQAVRQIGFTDFDGATIQTCVVTTTR